MKKIIVALLAVLWVMPAQALEIVATVDDEIITDQDVIDRATFAEKMFNVPIDKKMKGQILNSLIDEKVKRLTSKKAGISLTAEEIDEGIAYSEAQNKMNAGDLKKFVKENNLSMDALTAQVEADLLWLRYVQQNVKRPEVSDKEVVAERKKILEMMGKPAYLLAEIFIPFDGNETAAEQEAETLFNRIRAGESFTDLASEYSKGATAAQMGDLGWVKPKEMETAIDKVLAQMESGQLSRPIKGKKGYTLILMRDRQAPLDGEMQEVVQVSQWVIEKDKFESYRKDFEAAQNSCMSFTQFAATHGAEGSQSGALPEMMSARMPAEFKKLLDGKNLGELVGPVDMSPYMLFVMKCGSRETSVLPDKDTIKRQLEMQKMDAVAGKLLDDARQKVLVDKK